jgi:hypothetical protein
MPGPDFSLGGDLEEALRESHLSLNVTLLQCKHCQADTFIKQAELGGALTRFLYFSEHYLTN